MDAWEIFCELCKQVVESQNVYLEVVIMPGNIEMRLYPVDEEENDDSDDYIE